MKKILFLTEALTGMGGMENVTHQVIHLLKNSGYDATLFVLDNGEEQKSKLWMEGIRTFYSKFITKNRKIDRLIHVLRLSKVICKEKPDYIIVTNTLPCLVARRAIRLSGIRAKLFTWMHLPPADRYRAYYLNLADNHLAISREIKNQLVRQGVGAHSIDVIFNPVKRTSQTITRPSTFKVLYVGRVLLEDQKRLKDLMEAMSQLEFDWQLDVVGDGQDFDKCQEYAQKLGIKDKITWHGWQVDCWNYIEKHIGEVTCLALTSTHEGLPLVLLEAMARGVYCISSDCVSGPSDIIQNTVNGLLFEPRNIAALVAALCYVHTCVNLPDSELIKSSINNFYEENYIENFTASLFGNRNTKL